MPIQPVIRTNFADTAFWAAAVTTAPTARPRSNSPSPKA